VQPVWFMRELLRLSQHPRRNGGRWKLSARGRLPGHNGR